MLKRLRLRNFRVHDSVDAHFGPGLNVIVGPNNGGKTTLLRALMFLGFAETAGVQRCVRAGAKIAEVQANFDQGSVARRVGSSVSELVLRRCGETARFSNVSHHITSPQILEHLKAVGLAPMRKGVWAQFLPSDKLFLVGDTPAKVREVLSLLSFTDVFDAGAKAAATRVRSASSDERDLSSRVAVLRETVGTSRARVSALADALERAEALEADVGGTSGKIRALNLYIRASDASSRADRVLGRLSELQRLSNDSQDGLSSCVQTCRLLMGFLNAATQVRASEFLRGRLDSLLSRIDAVSSGAEEAASAVALVSKFVEATKARMGCAEEYRYAKDAHDAAREQARKFERCPVCGAPTEGSACAKA